MKSSRTAGNVCISHDAWPSSSDCLIGTSTGRVCDGYDPALLNIARSGSSSLTSSPSIPVYSSPEAARSLEFFKLKSLEQFTSIFNDTFWTETVLQLVHAEPAIEYAISTLSLVHENRLKVSVGETFDPGCALKYYNRAIKELTRAAVDTSAMSIEIQIVSCLIFYNIEALQGHLGTASELFSHGIRLLNEIFARQSYRPTTGSAFEGTMLSLMLTQFHRLHLQVNLVFNGPNLVALPFSMHSETVFKTPFTSLDDARLAMEHLCMSFMQSTLCASDKQLNTKRLNTWNHAFNNLLKRTTHTPSTLRAIAQLQGLERRLQIELKCFPDKDDIPTSEDSAPSSNSNLRRTPPDSPEIRRLHDEIVEYVAISLSGSCSELVFTPDVAIIPALCSVIKTCHDPRIRRKALKLCQSANRIEGVWPSALAARIMERYIMLVEQRPGGMSFAPDAELGRWSSEVEGEASLPLRSRSLNVDVVVHDVHKEAYVRYYSDGEEGFRETLVWT